MPEGAAAILRRSSSRMPHRLAHARPSGPSGRAALRRSACHATGMLERRCSGCPLTNPLKRFSRGAPSAPNALASAARAPSKCQKYARLRRPCRLHAVIRRLPAHGQRDLTLGRRTWPPPPTRDARAPRLSDRRAWRAMPEGAAAGLRRSSSPMPHRLAHARPSGPSGRAAPRRPVCHATGMPEAAPAGMPAGHPPQKAFVLALPRRLMPSHQLQGRHPNLNRTQDAGALVGCMQ
jgi:hypothetical protein